MMLINAFTFVWPVAFAVMLVASAILFLRTCRFHFLLQVAGFAALVASQALQFVYAQQFESGGGMVASLVALILWLSVCGLGVAAIGYVLQCIAKYSSSGRATRIAKFGR